MSNNRDSMGKHLLRVMEACDYLGVSRPTLYKLCERADFPVIRIGRAIRISRDGLERWLERNEGKQVL